MYFFAYGSLVNRERLAEYCPTARPVCTARIPNQALYFTGPSRLWGGGTATIGLAPACDLWGAVYEIDAAGRALIEELGATDEYVWAQTPVEDDAEERLPVGMLVKVRKLERADPSPEYLEVMTAGWRQWGLDPETILRDIPPTL